MTPQAAAHAPIPSIGSNDLAPPPASTLLHGVVLRPPALLWDGVRYTGSIQHDLDVTSARQVPGVVDVVVMNNFIGVIASQARQAVHARAQVQVQWLDAATPALQAPSMEHTAAAAPRPNSISSDSHVERSYSWPQAGGLMQAWAIAHYAGGRLNIWTTCSRPDLLRAEIALLCELDISAVTIIPNGQAGAHGYDVAADAALLSRWCGQPVRVQEDGSAERTPAATELQVRADAGLRPEQARKAATPASQSGNAEDGMGPRAYDYTVAAQRYNLRRPSIAALLCGCEQQAQPAGIALPTGYYPADTQHTVAPASVPIGATPDESLAAAEVFACESFFDELSRTQNSDPIETRLALLDDPTGRSLIRAVRDKANWQHRTPRTGSAATGKGFAYAHVIDNTQEPAQQVWSAWIAEVSVDKNSGLVDLTSLTVGHNAEALQNMQTPAADGAERLEQQVRDAATKLLRGPDGFDSWGGDKQDTADYPLSLPKVELVTQGQGALNAGLGWNPRAELPAAAAIANAIYDATGVRFRQPPFDSETLKTKLAAAPGSYKKLAYTLLGGIAATVAGLVVSAMPWRSAIAPLASVDTSIYSQAAINRGRLVAAAGDCIVCHTVEGGQDNAGGRPLETPFGTVYTTNITPDVKTGIGTWSFAAFERAMREGIHRDGRKLYPAFPYTAFAKITDPDMQALYAYLMTQKPVEAAAPKTKLAFPFNIRPVLAGWNLLFHRNEVYAPDPAQSTLWNRGAYLVQGAGHCAACHSPRNALGAEKNGKNDFLGGGFADGWEAPALNTLSKAPIAWTEDTLYDYLRTGYSSLHGVAAGPMAPVVQSMAELPDSDVRAVAHYLSSLNPPAAGAETPAMQAARLEDNSRNNPAAMTHPGENLFEGACAVCHDARGGPPLFGSRPSLALNSNLHSDSPDNVIQVLLHGIEDPAVNSLGNMPGFGASMNNQQLETLLSYLRVRFAPDKPAWTDLGKKIETIRNIGH
ncbi:c-type cytochrome [Eoetvoesiella caeni]